eukprot:m.270692 g.270692  ORF g.270692 m.270692 type:complete len:71 (+) comp48821_c0_seq1:41-253(+)
MKNIETSDPVLRTDNKEARQNKKIRLFFFGGRSFTFFLQLGPTIRMLLGFVIHIGWQRVFVVLVFDCEFH